MLKSVQEDKVRNAQIKLFRERVRPNIEFLSEGVDAVRGIKGLKRSVTKNIDVRWSDIIQFLHPKIDDVSIWDAFVEKYGHFLQFKTNPLENKGAFIQELHDLIERLNRSTITPNSFTVVRESPRPYPDVEGRPTMEFSRNGSPFESEKYPKQYKVEFRLEWIVKA